VTREEARLLLARMIVEIHHDGRLPLTRGAYVSDVAAEVIDEVRARGRREGLARSTVSSYVSSIRNHVVPLFENRPIASIVPEDIVAWVEYQEGSEAAAWSVRARWTALRMVFQHAFRHGLIHGNPCEALKPHERPRKGSSKHRYLDRSEIAALLGAASSLEDTAMLGLLLFCGLRASEVLGLVWDDIDFASGFVKVRYQMSRAGNRRMPLKMSRGGDDVKDRDVVLIDDLARVLRRFRLASPHSRPGDLLFAGSEGKTIGYWEMRSRFRVLREAVGLPDVTMHACRHTFASTLIALDAKATWVQNQLGHKLLSTTLDIYTHLFARREHAATARAAMGQAYGALLG
jgi:integrase